MTTRRGTSPIKSGFLAASVCALTTVCQAAVPLCTTPTQLSRVENCSTVASDPTLARSQTLDTRCTYHELLRNPQRFGLGANAPQKTSRPLLLLSFEKPRKSTKQHKHSVGAPGDNKNAPHFVRPPGGKYSNKAWNEIVGILDDGRPTLLTHITELTRHEKRWDGACALFSMYPTILSKCDGAIPEKASWSALRDSASAIDVLIEQSRATHIVLMSTGWNTSQAESLQNYASWIDELDAVARSSSQQEDFRPLFIGVTWESGVEGIPSPLSVTFRGNDADELGLTWINAFVNGVVGPSAKRKAIPVAVIGHSFGTRVVGSSVFLPTILPDDWRTPSFAPSLFIALQGAFPIRRFVDCSGKEPIWATGSEPATRVLLTTSLHDGANSTRAAGAYVGGKRAIEVKGSLQERSECGLTWLGDGHLKPDGELVGPAKKSALIDAKDVVNCQWPHTGGGAHSDVYDAATARFIMDALLDMPIGRLDVAARDIP